MIAWYIRRQTFSAWYDQPLELGFSTIRYTSCEIDRQ